MQSVVQNTSEKGDGILQIHIWNGRSGSSFIYYEDDGISLAEEVNKSYTRNLQFEPGKKQINLSAVKGTYQSRFKQVKLVMHGFSNETKSLLINGKKVKVQTNEQGLLEVLFANQSSMISIKY